MNNLELIKLLVKRIKKFSWLIALIALPFGAFFYFIAKRNVIVYTSLATVFPLNNAPESSPLSNILGLSDKSKSFSGEASVNIIDLATSRRTSEAVAKTVIREMGNKSLAQLLIEENNKHTGFLKNKYIAMPKDSLSLINLGTFMLKSNFTAQTSKSGMLQLNFTNSNPQLVRLISYTYIDKISEFYIELKKDKAQADYDFAVKKADSLLQSIKLVDDRLIKLDESTFFTNEGLKRYSIPKINLAEEKQSIQQQYYYAISNREAAAYNLQKETPIIKILDKPEPPYGAKKKSTVINTAIGLLLGTMLGIIIVSWKILYNYVYSQINKMTNTSSVEQQNNNPSA